MRTVCRRGNEMDEKAQWILILFLLLFIQRSENQAIYDRLHTNGRPKKV